MKTIVLYFSRTGNSKRVAEKIAQRTNSETACITDDESWKGPAGFAKGAMYAAKWESTHPVVAPKIDYSEYDKIVIVGPVWAGNPAPAVYSLIMQELAKYMNKVFLVLTCGGMNMPVLSKIENKLGKLNSAYVIAKFKNDENKAVDQIIEKLIVMEEVEFLALRKAQ